VIAPLTEPDKSARLDARRFPDEHLEVGVRRLDRWVLRLDELANASVSEVGLYLTTNPSCTVVCDSAETKFGEVRECTG
jgi:hypothetical protein